MQKLTWADHDLTHDAFLGCRIHLWQPKNGYRAGLDPVLLAASIPAKQGQSVLEIGCGAGTALLCLNARVGGLDLTGIELQPPYAALAQRNANGAAAIHTADLRHLPDGLRQRQFDHVMMNPPYFDRATGHTAMDQGRDMGRGGDTPLGDWIDVGIKRLAPKGYLTVIQHITRLPDVIAAIGGRLGSMVVKPIQPRDSRPANLFILQARQAGRAPFRMTVPMILHKGSNHVDGRETYTEPVQEILRDAAALNMSD